MMVLQDTLTSIETINKPDLENLQLERLQNILGYALKTKLYKDKLALIGITKPQDLTTLKQLTKLPFTYKNDLRDSYPFGHLAVPLAEVIRLHSSSGTTGTPTVIYYTRADLERWTELIARSILMTGGTQHDVFQNMMSYGLFTGGLGLHYGAENIGMLVIPAASGNTERQLKFMKDFGTTIVHATPSYLLQIHSKMAELGYSLADLQLKKAYCGAEPYSEETRRKLETLFNIKIYNSYGLSEMNGPGLAFECTYRQDMHIWEDGFLVEIIDPITGEQVPDGTEGEVVITNLIRTAVPLMRYRTRDLAYIYKEPCKCGRTHRRLSRIKGRTDDMLIINGVNVFPSQIEEVLMKLPECGTNYQIQLIKEGAIDKLIVKMEMSEKLFRDDVNEYPKLKERIKDALRASITIAPTIEFHSPGSLPVFEGKAQRVIDQRPKL